MMILTVEASYFCFPFSVELTKKEINALKIIWWIFIKYKLYIPATLYLFTPDLHLFFLVNKSLGGIGSGQLTQGQDMPLGSRPLFEGIWALIGILIDRLPNIVLTSVAAIEHTTFWKEVARSYQLNQHVLAKEAIGY